MAELLKMLCSVRTPTDRASLKLGGWHGGKSGIPVIGTESELRIEWGLLNKHTYVIPLGSISDWNKRPYMVGPVKTADIFTINYTNQTGWKTTIEIIPKNMLISLGLKGNLEEYLMNLAGKQPKNETKQKDSTCPKCGLESSEDDSFCKKCGTALKPSTRKCNKCGKNIEKGANFCPLCGAKKP